MENDFIKLIETRRSIRSYKKEPVFEKALNKILEAGTYAPPFASAKNPINMIGYMFENLTLYF